MAIQSENLKLTLPQATDFVSAKVLAENFKSIDEAVTQNKTDIQAIAKNSVTESVVAPIVQQYVANNSGDFATKTYVDAYFPVKQHNISARSKWATFGTLDSNIVDVDHDANTVRIAGFLVLGGASYTVDKTIALTGSGGFIIFDTAGTYETDSDRLIISSTLPEEGVMVGYARYASAPNGDRYWDVNVYEASTVCVNGTEKEAKPCVFVTKPSVMDWTTLKLTIGNGVFFDGTQNVTIPVTTLDIPASMWGCIVYDKRTQEFRVNNANAKIMWYMTVIGSFNSAENYICIPALPNLTQVTKRPEVYTNGTVSVMNNRPKIACFGDSITAGVGAIIPFTKWASVQAGVYLCNYGIGGTGYTYTRGTDVGEGGARVGDGTCELAPVVSSIPESNKFADYIDLIMSADEAPETDYVLVQGGTNDYNAGVSIETLKTAVRSTINTIYNLSKTPIIVTPPPQGTAAARSTNDGVTKEQFVQAIIDVCKEMNCMCIDIYHNCGLNATNTTNLARCFGDYVHPNAEGHRLISNAIVGKLREIAIY